MLEIIVGGCGSGKTTRVLEMFAEDALREPKRNVFLIVPEQETVAIESRVLDILPPSAALNAEVLNFSRLANRVFRKYGGLTYNYVGKGVKSLAAWNAVRTLSPVLREYGAHRNFADFGDMILSAIEEFKAYSVSPAALERAMEKAPKDSRLASKLYDLSLIYATYNNMLSGYGDGSDDIGKLASVLAEHDFFAGASVYIDSFSSFTGAELRVISRIVAGAEKTVVTVCAECDGNISGLQFDAAKRTLASLGRIAEKNGAKVKTTYLRGNMRAKKKSLSHLSANIWNFGGGNRAAEDDESVEFIKCTNVYEEAEAVSARISALVRGGMRYRDIGVVARRAESYAGIIDASLEKSGIPYFMSLPSDISSLPLPGLIMGALHLKNRDFRTEDVISYVKTELCGLDGIESDLFCDYVSRWELNGEKTFSEPFTMNPDGYSQKTGEKQEKKLEIINGAREKLIAPLASLYASLAEAESNRDLCRAVFEYMNDLHASESMQRFAEEYEAAGDKAEAGETLRLYNALLDVLGMIADFDCGEVYSLPDFETALGVTLSQTSIGSIPTSCDEVTVGSASMLRAGELKVVFMIGVGDGVFPAPAKESELLSDEDRSFLSESGIELSGGVDEKSSNELFYVYRAMSAPSEKLIMTYPMSKLSGGDELKPSVAYERAKLLTAGKETEFSRIPLEERLERRGPSFEYSANADDECVRNALRRYFATRDDYRNALAALDIPVYDRKCRMSAEVTDEVLGDKLLISPSALEKYVACHFGYYCENVLRLRPDSKNVFRANNTGEIIHGVLEDFVKEISAHGKYAGHELSEEEINELIEHLVSERIKAEVPERDALRESVKHRFRKFGKLSELVAKSVMRELSESGFRPEYFELDISERGEVKPAYIDLGGGKKALLRGKVDRVDVLRDGGDVYVKVVDYKTGSKEFSAEDIKKGRNLQMLFYLFTLCTDANKRFFGVGEGELVPAGVIYLSSRVKRGDADMGADEDEITSNAEASLTRSGIMIDDECVKAALNKNGNMGLVFSGGDKKMKKAFVSRETFDGIRSETREVLTKITGDIRSGDAGIYPTDEKGKLRCDYCEMKAVCRSPRAADDAGDGENENENENEGGGNE